VADGADRLFRFAQFEFPWAIGPAAGRYVVRPDAGAQPTHVVVIATLGAPERRLLRRRRAERAEPSPAAEPVTTGRVTIVDAEPTGGADEAAAWLREVERGSVDFVDAALRVANGVIHANRIATADPYANGVGVEQALVVRLGYGAGEEVADGRWSEAVALPPSPERGSRRRSAALRPQERLAALLTGKDRPLVCEELLLRARLDLDEDRPREAALQLRVALEAAIAELGALGRADLAQRVEGLRELRGDVGAAANAALEGPLSAERAERVEFAVGRIEAALRARTAFTAPTAGAGPAT
jgi:hypothetical protein